jgi:hypothetical protein
MLLRAIFHQIFLLKENWNILLLKNTINFHRTKKIIQSTKELFTRSLLGILISTFIGIMVLRDLVLITNEASFLLLIPLYIVNYLVIRLITGKIETILLYFLFYFVILSTVLPFILF